MDAYGVVGLGGGFLSVPGLLFYLFVLSISITLSTRLVDSVVPKAYRKLNYFTAGLSASIIATWAVISLGLWFYVS